MTLWDKLWIAWAVNLFVTGFVFFLVLETITRHFHETLSENIWELRLPMLFWLPVGAGTLVLVGALIVHFAGRGQWGI